jgi:hypothetical protein
MQTSRAARSRPDLTKSRRRSTVRAVDVYPTCRAQLPAPPAGNISEWKSILRVVQMRTRTTHLIRTVTNLSMM